MATIIQQPSALEFSGMLPDVIFGSNADHSVVSVIITASGETRTVFSETLFPTSGRITLEEIPDMVSPYARQSLTLSLTVRIEEFNAAGQSVATLSTTPSTVICGMADVGEPASVFCQSHFLTILNGTKLTSMGLEERLYAYGTAQVTVTGTYCQTDGSLDERSATLTAAATTSGVSAFFVSPSDMDILLGGTGTLVGYSVEAGGRRQRFEVRELLTEPSPSLAFINSFGVTEFIHCVGTHQKDAKFTRSTGRFHGKRRNYRIEEDRQFKASTGWLNEAMADWADDLFRSLEVYLWVDGTTGREVVLSDSQSVVSSDDDDMPSYEFTYGYSQRNHNVMQRSHAGRIFDNTFDHTFN